jgi:dihydropteroate synthase
MTYDKRMMRLVADHGLPAVIMHMQGRPKDMQNSPSYKDVTREVIQYLKNRISQLRKNGVERIIADPGIGFGKTMEHNFELIDRLDEFAILETPILMGLSRKSLIGKALGRPAEERLPATVALNLVALDKGASLIRVHDVKEGKETLILHEKLRAHRKSDA